MEVKIYITKNECPIKRIALMFKVYFITTINGFSAVAGGGEVNFNKIVKL